MKKFTTILLAVSLAMLAACSSDPEGTVAYTVDVGSLDGIQSITITVDAQSATIDVSGTTRASGVIEGVSDGSHMIVAEAYGADASAAAISVSAEVELTETARNAVALLQFGAPEITGVTVSNANPKTGEEIQFTAEVSGGGSPLLVWTDNCAGTFGDADGNSVMWSSNEAAECQISVEAAGADTDATTVDVLVGYSKGSVVTVAGNGCFINGDYDLDWYTADGEQMLSGVWDENGMAVDDGAPATSVRFNKLGGIDWDDQGRLLFADRMGGRVFRVEADGTLTRLVGNRVPDYDDGQCNEDPLVGDDCLNQIAAIDFHPESGKLYIASIYRGGEGIILADLEHNTMSEIYDDGSNSRYHTGIAVDHRGDIFLGQAWDDNLYRIEYYDYAVPETTRTTSEEYLTNGALSNGGPWDVALAEDAIYYTARHDSQVWKMDMEGNHELIGGDPTPETVGYSGDGGPATEATISNPRGLVLHPDGSVIFADSGNESIRKISPDGTISTLLTNVGDVWDLLLDDQNNLYMSGHSFCEVRKVYGPF